MSENRELDERDERILTALGNLKADLMAGQARTDAKVEGLTDRLDTLNGKIPEIVKEVNDLKLKQAANPAMDKRIDELKESVTKLNSDVTEIDKGLAVERSVKAEKERGFTKYVQPVIRFVMAAALGLVAGRSHDIVKFIWP